VPVPRHRYIGASDDGKAPELFLFYPEQGFKYKLQKPFAYKDAKQFLQDYQAGKVKPFTKSEEVSGLLSPLVASARAVPPPPAVFGARGFPVNFAETRRQIKEGWDKGVVKELVGKQVPDLVAKKDKHYVVMVYAPWCGHCKTFMPKYDKAAAHFEAKYGDEIVFARMDGTANEIEGYNVQGFPTVLVYPKGVGEDGPTDVSQSTEVGALAPGGCTSGNPWVRTPALRVSACRVRSVQCRGASWWTPSRAGRVTAPPLRSRRTSRTLPRKFGWRAT